MKTVFQDKICSVISQIYQEGENLGTLDWHIFQLTNEFRTRFQLDKLAHEPIPEYAALKQILYLARSGLNVEHIF